MNYGISTVLESATKRFDFSPAEKEAIGDKIKLTLISLQFFAIKVAAIINIFAAAAVVKAQYNFSDKPSLMKWLFWLAAINVFNIIYSLYYDYAKPPASYIKRWLSGYRICIVLSSLAWVSLLLVETYDLSHYFFMLYILIGVIACFAFGTITDFPSSALSISLLIGLTALYDFYHAMLVSIDNEPYLYLYCGIALLMYAAFLLPVAYACNYLLRRAVSNQVTNKFLADNFEKKVEERTAEIEYQSNHDILTGLPNTKLLDEYLSGFIKISKSNNIPFFIAFLSIDRMHVIFDNIGYHVENKLVKLVANRLRKKFPNDKSTTNDATSFIAIARRDLFVIAQFIPENTDPTSIITEVFTIFDSPFHIQGKNVVLTASIGASIYPDDGVTSEALMSNAVSALNSAQTVGGNNLTFYKSLDKKLNELNPIELESDLHSALKNNELYLVYQPIPNMKSGKVESLEVLIRWKHPKHGIIPPVKFIPIAEEVGLITPIGEWVLREACCHGKKLLDLGFNIKIAVNISPIQLEQENIVNVVTNILDTTMLPPENLILELTESMMVKSEMSELLTRLHDMNINIALDDYGTGYASLGSLSQLPIDKLKIDRSFVKNININKKDTQIVLHGISMAQSLNIKVVAEGVDMREQVEFLINAGIDDIQGFYFSKPLIFNDLIVFLNDNKEKNFAIDY